MVDLRGEARRAGLVQVPALDKGLDILELLASEPSGLTKTEIARRLQRSVSEIFRPLLCLENRGYVRKFEDGSFWITRKLLMFRPAYLSAERLLTGALPVMRCLSNRLGQSCYLGVRDDASVTIIAHVDSPVGLSISVKTGSEMDLMYTVMGNVLLAHLSDETRRVVIRVWQSQHRTTMILPADLDIRLALIRRNGYAKDQSRDMRRSIHVAYPLLNENGEAFAVLGVSYLARIQEPVLFDSIRSALRSATEVLSSRLEGHYRHRKGQTQS